MKPDNKLNKGAYFLVHLFYIVVAYIWYNNLLFECLKGKTYEQSRCVFWLIVISGCSLCYTLTFKRSRTNFNAIINVLFSFGIYAMLSFYSILKTHIVAGLCIILVVAVLLGYFIFSKKIISGTKFFGVLIRRFCNWFLACRFVSTMVAVSVIGIGMASVIMNGNMLLAKTEAVIVRDAVSEWRISKKLDELRVLQEDEWSKLDIQQKLNTLQIVANIEARFLGIGHELNVGASPLSESSDGKTLGQYTYTTRTISIDTDYLESASAKEVMITLLHEARHAYQRRAIEALKCVPEEYYDLYMFYEVCGFQNGFENYGEDSPEGYTENNLEIDARKYALENVVVFYEELEKCIKNEGGNNNE